MSHRHSVRASRVVFLRLFSRDKPRRETVTCSKLTAKHAEYAGALWAKRWVDAHGGDSIGLLFARTTRPQASRVEQVGPLAHRIVTRLYRQGAMSALCPVHDTVDATATTPATIVTLKASAFQKNRGGRTHLLEAGGAGERQAGVTNGDARSIDEHSPCCIGSRDNVTPATKGEPRANPGALGPDPPTPRARLSVLPTRGLQMCGCRTVSTTTVAINVPIGVCRLGDIERAAFASTSSTTRVTSQCCAARLPRPPPPRRRRLRARAAG